MTALTSIEDEEDDFFGSADECDDVVDGGCAHGSLQEREQRATEARYHNIGYLEAYDENKDLRNQEGFEAGYKETFDHAYRIGELLGSVSMVSPNSTNQKGQQAVARVRAFLENFMKEDNAHHLDEKLSVLHTELKGMVQKDEDKMEL